MPPRPTKRRAHAAYLRAFDVFFEFCNAGGLGPHCCSSPESHSPRRYVGYVVFVLLALLKRCRIDLLQVFAPWAIERCETTAAVDAIPCIMIPDEAGWARIEQVSEVHPLTERKHFLAGLIDSSTLLADQPAGIRSFYAQRHVVVISTALDGDCGLDVACMMLGLPRTLDNRSELRNALADYLCDRAEEPWMHDLLVATAEIDLDLVQQMREESKPQSRLHPIPSGPSTAVQAVQASPQ